MKQPYDPPFVPQVDLLISNTGELIMKVDISGIENGDIETTVKGSKVRVKGKRHDPDAGHARTLLINEIPVGPFEFVVEVPSGFAASAAKSTYVHGVLRITVPPEKPSADFTNPEPSCGLN